VPSRHDPPASLPDILENLVRIERYAAGLDREAFVGNTLRRDAVERCPERICKAAFRLWLASVSHLRLRLGLFELSTGLDQSCLTLRELRFRPLKSRFGLCQCHLAVSRIQLGNGLSLFNQPVVVHQDFGSCFRNPPN